MTAALLGAAGLLILCFAPAQYLGRQQDDLMYLIAAHALPTGRYELITAVGHPPLTSTAPGWPLILSPLALMNAGPAAFQALAALILALCPLLIWLWLRKRTEERNALIAAGLFASAPVVLSQAGTLMPEAAYTALFLGAMLALESGRRLWAGAAGALLVLVRPAAVSALPAFAAGDAWKGKWKDAARALGPALIAAAAWSAWSMKRAGNVQEASELALAYGKSAQNPLSVAWSNAVFFASELGGAFVPPRHADGALALLLGAVLMIAAAYGLFKVLRRSPGDPAGLSLLGAAGMHALWTWHYERYLIPLFPLLFLAWIEAFGKRAPRILAALLAAQIGFQVLPRLGRPSPWGEPELSRTYAWLAAQEKENGALASAMPVRDGWHARRPCVSLPDDADAADFSAALKRFKVRYVLRQDGLDFGLSAGARAPLQILVDRAYGHLEDRKRFKPVHQEPAERATVYEPL